MLRLSKLQEKLGVIITGIRDNLLALTSANFQLSQQHLQALNKVRGDLEVYWGRQQQATAQMLKVQEGLELLRAGSAARHERMVEIMQAVLDRLNLAPQQLAAEVQHYTSSQGQGSEGEESSLAERQVRFPC